MPTADINISELKCTGEGTCAGGDHPDPPLDAYPLLAWSKAHPRFGAMVVHLEDQKASVHDVAAALAACPSLESLAAKFATTTDHVRQAIDYAVARGFLGR